MIGLSENGMSPKLLCIMLFWQNYHEPRGLSTMFGQLTNYINEAFNKQWKHVLSGHQAWLGAKKI